MKKNLLRPSALAFALALSSVACSTVPTSDIKSQAVAAPEFKVSAYKTYGWYGGAALLRDPLKTWSNQDVDMTEEAKFLIDSNLRDRGLTVGSEPDLLVAFLLVNDMNELKKVESERGEDLPKLVGVGQGALVIELIDAKTGHSVWLGAATAETESGRSAEVMKDRLKYAVNAVLGQIGK